MIGTLTFHEALSYGAVLQAYALQSALLRMGVDTEIVNYRCPAIWNRYYPIPHNARMLIGRILRSSWYGRKINEFKRFRKEKLKMSELVNRNNLSYQLSKYSTVIVGSDQVWNPDLTDGDTSYFLDCAQNGVKKSSYAASLGAAKWPHDKEQEYLSYIRDFSTICLREQTAAHYLNTIGAINSTVVCDPTFLIEADEWSEIASNPPSMPGYVLVYTINRESGCVPWARRLAEYAGLEMVVIHTDWHEVKNARNIRDASPEAFLGWLANAAFVVTDSYHGVCLSINLRRSFVWFRRDGESHAERGRESRLIDLLALLGLSDRAVTHDSCMPLPIEYDSINPVLSALREKGLSALRRMAIEMDE